MKSIEVSQTAKLNTLLNNPYFEGLPEAVLKDIALHTLLHEYERGDVLFWEGDTRSALMFKYLSEEALSLIALARRE